MFKEAHVTTPLLYYILISGITITVEISVVHKRHKVTECPSKEFLYETAYTETTNPVYTSPLSLTCYMPRPSHSRFDRLNNIG